MIPSPVFSVWTFTLSSRDQEAELVLEEDANPESEPNIEFPRKTPWNGSEENMMVPSTTDRLYLFKTFVPLNLLTKIICIFSNLDDFYINSLHPTWIIKN
jgi:hypothetical protein